jgi:hypothetical protein
MSARLRIVTRAAVIAGLCMVWTTAAWAPGSVGLDEVLQIVSSEPKLLSEIEVALRRRDLKVPEIVCVGARHGNQWRFLGGERSAPYECRIGDTTVTIEAERTYYDINRHKLGQLGQAPDALLFNRAKSFRESRFRWTWSP